MTYAFIQDVPANEQHYREIRAELGEATPAGLVAHVVVQRDGGLRYVDVWESRDAWERFREQRLHPAVDKVMAAHGVNRDEARTSFEEIRVIDTWLG